MAKKGISVKLGKVVTVRVHSLHLNLPVPGRVFGSPGHGLLAHPADVTFQLYRFSQYLHRRVKLRQRFIGKGLMYHRMTLVTDQFDMLHRPPFTARQGVVFRQLLPGTTSATKFTGDDLFFHRHALKSSKPGERFDNNPCLCFYERQHA